ncbi:hypothetical protein SISNIDRAFT_160360 [Sistotremastrum niveocremeum HHB9708]|uniref:Uncharacterized protein n=1 Tax=Sistotremastrum niveocremeum HHB9708 TaxID=1314777 RepID=A0A164SWJ9_9AGAM|nr:hypothetical protein SISNIDRAFT_160360 [Sistotremastrum niveocremeum HHB9708]
MASTSSHLVLLAELPNLPTSLGLSNDTILNLAKFLPKSSEIDDEDFPYYVAVDPACIFCRITDAKLCIGKKTGCCWRCSNEGLRCTRVSWLSQGGESSKQAQNGSALEPFESPSGFCGNPGKREPGDTCIEVTQLDAKKEGTLGTSVGQIKISLVNDFIIVEQSPKKAGATATRF